MRVRWLQLAGVAAVLAGCPKDPDAVNPLRDAAAMDGDAADSETRWRCPMGPRCVTGTRTPT